VSGPAPAGGGRYALRVAAGIFVTRVLGYVRERVFAYYLGNGAVADACRAALRIPNVVRNLLGEGTLSASFIPAYAALNERDPNAARALANAVLGLLAAAAAGIALLGIAVAPVLTDVVAPGFSGGTRDLTVTLVRMLFPMTGLMVISAWCLGVLNTHRRFFLPYAAPALWNIAGIAALVAAGTWFAAPELPPDDQLRRIALALAWGTVVGSLLQVAVQLPTCWRLLRGLAPRVSLGVAGVREVLYAWLPLVLGAGVAQISALIDTFLGSLAGVGGVASLSYAQLVQTLPISIFGVSIAAVALPELSREAAGSAVGAPNELLRSRLATGFRRIAFFVAPSAFAFAALGDVIVAALFQTGRFGASDTSVVGGVLACYGIGLLGAASAKLFASGFFALRDTRTPVRISIATLALSSGLAALLMRPFGVAGIALGSSIGATVTLLTQLRFLERRIGPVLDRNAWQYLTVVVIASILAAGVGVGTAFVSGGLAPIPRAAVVLGAFGLVYVGVTVSFKHPEAVRLWSLLRT
jgi:putative peptidoglycan lipid II flippase